MRELIERVVDELVRSRREGVSGLYIADGTLESLEALVAKDTHETAHESGDAPDRELILEPDSRGEGIRESGKTSSNRVEVKPGVREIAPIPDPPSVELPEGDRAQRWQWLRDRVLECPVCNAHVKPGKKVVFGVGNIEADIFFCGEAPGAEEEVQGEPFVGRAGQLLTKIIEAMGLTRSDAYIGNIMNWRPEMPTAYGNRPPTAAEFNFCLPYLRAQLEIVQPAVIVALGATAVNGLLGPDSNRRMGAVRGKWFSFEGVPLIITYHPSYVLRNGSMRTKRLVWEDMLQVMDRSGLPVSEKQRGYFKSSD